MRIINMKTQSLVRIDGIQSADILRVRAEMLAAGISQAEWARANGFTRQQVADVLTGRRLCLRGASHAVAVALGLKVGRIVKVRNFKPAHKHQGAAL
jgi:gp16 family phage-associated protein